MSGLITVDELMNPDKQPTNQLIAKTKMPSTFGNNFGNGLLQFGMGLLANKKMPEALGLGMKGFIDQQQKNKAFQAYSPYFDKLGIDTTSLNPMYGGSGFGEINPIKLIDLEDTLENREINRLYKQSQMNYLNDKQDLDKQKTENQQTTLKKLMGYDPTLRNYYAGMVDPQHKYDFSGGKNQSYLESGLLNMGTDINAPMPMAMGQTIIQRKPQQAQSNMEYKQKSLELRQKQIENQITTNQKRLALYERKIRSGQASNGDKAAYNALRNENLRLGIEQKKLINNILEKGDNIPNVPVQEDNNGYAF